MIVNVGGDYGGNVAAYSVYEKYLEERGDEVQLVGPCASACTILLRLPPERICATDRGELQFHAGSTVAATDAMWRSYPKEIQAWIAERGGLTARWLQLRGQELFTLIRRCE